MVLRKLSIPVFLLLLLSVSPVRADSATVDDISKKLICQCSCMMVLGNCSHVECTSREAMTAVIEQRIAEGQSEEQIIQSFVAQYGEKALATLPKQGLNLTAWVLPFVAIIGAGGVIYVALKKWVRQGKNRQATAVTEAQEGDEEYQRRLEEELEEFTERGFR